MLVTESMHNDRRASNATTGHATGPAPDAPVFPDRLTALFMHPGAVPVYNARIRKNPGLLSGLT